MYIIKSALAVSVAIALFSTPAMATNGLAPTGLGQVHKAMGGAAAGNPQNTMSMASNPASASFIDNGVDLAIEVFKPNRAATTNTPAHNPAVEYSGDGRSTFLIPEMGYKRGVSGRTALGIVIYGNGGMNTEYKAGSLEFPAGGVVPMNGVGPGGKDTGVNLEQLFVSPTVSIKVNQRHSLGLSLNLVRQQFEATGLSAFLGDPRVQPALVNNITDAGVSTSTGVGATVGWMGKFNRLTAGASYRGKVKMKEFEEYKGLFPSGKMNIPAALTVGASMQITPRTLVAADVQKIYYSKESATGNSASSQNSFGTEDGPGFGWDDQTIFKLGVKHQATPKLALMGGLNYGKSPVGPEDTFFNTLTPAVVEKHVSFGAEYALTKNTKLVGSFTKTFENEVKGDLSKGQPFDIKMDQMAFGIGLSVKM